MDDISNPFGFIEDFVTLLTTLIDLVFDSIATLYKTINMINGVNFENFFITEYLGYVRYVMGDYLWSMLWLCCAIPVGVFIFNSLLKGFSLIRDMINN